MTCPGACKHEFCFACLGDWKGQEVPCHPYNCKVHGRKKVEGGEYNRA